MVDFTVALPTYNGEHRFPDVLERLRSQINTEHFSWEIIVVDNNSSDQTAEVVRAYQANWSSAYPLKYCFAPEQGAAFARQRAIEKAQGQLIGFLDDDNLPALDWVAAAYAFGIEHPEVGAYGSQIHGYFFEQTEDQLPDNFNKLACFLGIIERGNKALQYQPQHKILPPGAGLVVRKKVWETTVPKRLVLNHKGKDAGLASEDLEALLHIQRAGWEIWYNPAMVVYHKIPNSRLQNDYIRLLFRCVGLSRHHLRMLTLKSWQQPLVFPAYLLNDLRKLVFKLLKQRITKTDLVTTCEIELLSSSLMSPLFLWKKQHLERLTERNYLPVAPTEDWLGQFSEAFEKDSFCLYSQSIRPVNDEKLGFEHSEIFLRLEDQAGKLLLPGQFLPIAERYDLMRTIDRWVIRKFLKTISTGKEHKPFLYEINLSTATLKDDKFIDFLKQELKLHLISPNSLCFSITESMVMANLERVSHFIHVLKEIGCLVTLEHINYRIPANYFEKLPIDYLKIDGNLVKETGNRQVSKIEKINCWGQKKGINTVAEYIENRTTYEKVKAIGINYVQGYAIGSIQPLEQKLLRT